MLKAFEGSEGKKQNYEIVRRFGYGVPDYERATASATSHLALFAQAEMQPFKLDGQRKYNECHYYALPIPADMLERLENEPVELKITLSYFRLILDAKTRPHLFLAPGLGKTRN